MGRSPPLKVLRTAYLDRPFLIAGLHGFEAHKAEDGGRLYSDNSSGMIVHCAKGSGIDSLQKYFT
jgi:hypothetical protein